MCAHCDFIVLDKCGVCSDVSDVRSCVWALVSVSYLCCRQTEVQDVQDGLHTRDNWIPTVEQASRTILVFPLLQTQLQCQAHTTWGWLDFRSVAAEQCCNVLLNIWARKRLEKKPQKNKTENGSMQFVSCNLSGMWNWFERRCLHPFLHQNLQCSCTTEGVVAARCAAVGCNVKLVVYVLLSIRRYKNMFFVRFPFSLDVLWLSRDYYT